MAFNGPMKEASRRIRSLLFSPRFVILVLSIILFYFMVFAIEFAALRALGIHSDGSTLGFMEGFLIATFVCAVLYVVIITTGAGNFLTGGLAERWTKREFSSLGKEWHCFSNVPFSVGREQTWIVDVDHIVVGPYGVLVVETKFSSAPLDLGAATLEQRITEAMVQVEDNAGRVRALLQTVAPDAPIRPVIVFWGRLVKAPSMTVRRVGGRVEDVRIIHGADAKRWRPRLLDKVVVADDAITQITARIANYQATMNRDLALSNSK